MGLKSLILLRPYLNGYSEFQASFYRQYIFDNDIIVTRCDKLGFVKLRSTIDSLGVGVMPESVISKFGFEENMEERLRDAARKRDGRLISDICDIRRLLLGEHSFSMYDSSVSEMTSGMPT